MTRPPAPAADDVGRVRVFTDPLHGLIRVPPELMQLVQTPAVQRLRRIRQLGVGHLVFPGAEHSRFGHALGAMALMQDALRTFVEKGTPIRPEEHTAALSAALLHDIGHGPFSHTLESELIRSFRHEAMSRLLIDGLNRRLGGTLTLALSMFDDAYHRPFFHQLVASQLDMDRLDYLRRDSLYTGVVEGEVGVQRIIQSLRVNPVDGGPGSRVVVEAKGIYAVENYLIARRLMYWQVYLHKTVIAGDELMRAILRRVRALGPTVSGLGSPTLAFFLDRELTGEDIAEPDVWKTYVRLDDSDVVYSIKRWAESSDPILTDLSHRFLNRDFFRVRFLTSDPTAGEQAEARSAVAAWLAGRGLEHSDEVAGLYVSFDRARHEAYAAREGPIHVIDRSGQVRELSESADSAAVSALRRFEEKPYVSLPREVDTSLTPD